MLGCKAGVVALDATLVPPVVAVYQPLKSAVLVRVAVEETVAEVAVESLEKPDTVIFLCDSVIADSEVAP